MYLECNEKENSPYHNLWNTEKAIWRGKFIAVNIYFKKTKKNREIPNK
jgi:hypothetical protein